MAGSLADLREKINRAEGEHQQLTPAVRDLTSWAGGQALAIDKTIKEGKGVNGGFPTFGHFLDSVKTYYNPHAAKPRPGLSQQEVFNRAKSSIDRWGNDFEIRKANSPLGMAETFMLSDGGVLVPPEFVSQILMRTYANDLMARCTVLPIGGNMIKIPAIAETSRADGSRFGGVLAYWRREAGSVGATKPALQDIELSLNSLMLFIRATQELLDDTGGALEVLLTSIAAQELAFRMGDAIFNGDGVGKPLGLMKHQSRVTQAAESGQGAGTIVSKNILNMWSRLHVSARPNAVWLTDQSIEPALGTMTIGTGGAQLVQFQPRGGLSEQGFATILGRPMVATEFGKPLGTEGDIVLADLSQYLVATNGGVQTAVSMHLYFDTNEMAFRFIIRLDGKPWWIKALSPKSGGPTQSWCVTLSSNRT